ncbi:hypothetical protein [Haliangium sp.]
MNRCTGRRFDVISTAPISFVPRGRAGGLLLLAVIAHGCSEAPDPGCEPGPPVSDEATVAYDELGKEYCRYLERCRPDSLQRYHGGDLHACLDYAACTQAVPADWKVTEACIEAMRAATCDDDIASTMYQSSVCQIGGPVPLAQRGDACRYSLCRPGADVPASYVRCDKGLFCGRGDRCVAYVAEGERCAIDERPGAKLDPCEPGTYCDFVDGRCRKELEAGAPCEIRTSPGGTLQTDPCAWPVTCDNGVCVEPEVAAPRLVEEGEACEPGARECQQGLACAERTCRALTCEGGTGSPCDGASCADELTCNSRTEQCEPRGAACDDETLFCGAGEFCDDDGTCQTLPAG